MNPGALFAADHLGCKAILALIESGATPLWMSRYESGVPLHALMTHELSQRKMALYRNVRPLILPRFEDRDTALDHAERILGDRSELKPGDTCAITCGKADGLPGRHQHAQDLPGQLRSPPALPAARRRAVLPSRRNRPLSGRIEQDVATAGQTSFDIVVTSYWLPTIFDLQVLLRPCWRKRLMRRQDDDGAARVHMRSTPLQESPGVHAVVRNSLRGLRPVVRAAATELVADQQPPRCQLQGGTVS